MRCINCGWDNLPNVKVCLKCGQPLSESNNNNNQINQTTGNTHENCIPKPTVLNSNNESEYCRKTVILNSATNTDCNESIIECPKCHYPIVGGFTSCPSCGTPISKNDNEIHRLTIRKPIKNVVDAFTEQKPICSLTIVPEEHENLTVEPIKHEGNSIILNRANTEPSNRTITSKEQAEITFEDGHWFLKNCSELNTTYLQVSRKIEIFPNDIIVLGDRRFKFESNTDTEYK